MGHCSLRTSKMLLATIKEFDRVLGLKLDSASSSRIPEKIQALATARETFRKSKKWSQADRIRNAIKKLGYEIRDTPSGPRVEKS